MCAAQSSDNSKEQAESKQLTPAPPPPPPAAPHMFQEIIATAPDSEEKNPDPAALEGKVYFLEGNTKKYWVKNNRNYFKLLPRGLDITWCGSSDNRYWVWKPLQEEGSCDDAGIEVAELKAVCWLEVVGKMELSHLTPGVVYKVFFEIKMKEGSYGWSQPVTLRLKTPYGSIVQERMEHLKDKPREEWLDILAGEMKAHKGQRGNLFISFTQLASDWKNGLVIKGLRITPRKA